MDVSNSNQEIHALYQSIMSTLSILPEELDADMKLLQHRLESMRVELMNVGLFRNIALHMHGKTPEFIKAVENVRVLPDNDIYRVGDAFNGCVKVLKGLKEDTYVDTIMGAYSRLEGICFSSNIKYLGWLVGEYSRKHNIKTEDDALYLHFRCGDITPVNIKEANRRVLSELSTLQNVSKIYVVTALHYGVHRSTLNYKSNILHTHKYESSTARVIEGLEQIFSLIVKLKETGLEVSIISNKAVDMDMCILSSAKNVVYTAGGFSSVCERLNQNRHGTSKSSSTLLLERSKYITH